MAISTAARKAKGRKLQQLVRDKITEMLKPFGVVAEDVKSTSMGASGKDVTLSPFAKSFLPVAIECKSHKNMAVYGWWEQTASNAESDEQPLLVIKANNRKPLAIIDLDYYMELESERIKGEK